MPDWKKSMSQTFEYYTVDPLTWKTVKKINTIKSCSIDRDSETDTLGSATIDTTELLGECYIRPVLVTVQDRIEESHPLGTFLVQSPSESFDGKNKNVSLDAYTPLIELKENPTPLGYYLAEGDNIMSQAYRIVREQARAPVVEASCSETLPCDFVSNVNDTWMLFTSDLIYNAKYEYALDELGRILFSPIQDIASLQPVWDYIDDGESILYPEVTVDRDLFGIPNVVEVIYSNGMDTYYAKAVNDDSNSPISTVSRGREIRHRDTNPSISGEPNQEMIDEYAEQLLKRLSTIQYTISYTHGYCPVRLGDCVRITYEKAGLFGVKAKVISQNISCTPGCPVKEKAVFTSKLWG